MNDNILKIWFDYFDEGSVLVVDLPQLKIWKTPNTAKLEISWVKLFDVDYVKMTDKHWNAFESEFSLNSEGFRKYTESISFRWNPADLIYYQLNAASEANSRLGSMTARRLSLVDQEAFDKMTALCSEEDLDAGFVELDHPIVVGAFEGETMISRASAYPFLDSDVIADIGYVSAPSARGKGAASLCVSYLCQVLHSQGKTPQIRVQQELVGSIKVAERAGFKLVGSWKYDFQN